MIFEPMSIPGLHKIQMQRHFDERGSFGRAFCSEEFVQHGLVSQFPQSSVSVTRHAGTLRGMHFQRAPHEEVKLVRCVRGAIFDVIADLRRESPTFGHWQAFELSADDGCILYIPVGCAHGFLTLSDDVEVNYSMSTAYQPGFASGFRYDDPLVGIRWPGSPILVNAKDLSWSALDAARDNLGG